MISEELKKYIDLVESQTRRGQLHEMANIGPRRHGIENVYIFVGSVENSPQHLRVKVSNVPGNYSSSDNFTIRLPSLDYDPKQVASWITPKIIGKIKSWIVLNSSLLHAYELGEMTDTDDFLDGIAKV